MQSNTAVKDHAFIRSLRTKQQELITFTAYLPSSHIDTSVQARSSNNRYQEYMLGNSINTVLLYLVDGGYNKLTQ